MRRGMFILILSLSIIFAVSFSIAAECNDHADNDGNGYCDYISQSGYCYDGSILGDPNCQDFNSKEGASCIPSKEICDGLDNDCVGFIDEEITETRSCGLNTGECSYGIETRSCSYGQFASWGNCQNAVPPSQEICDGLDNDCNSIVDDNCPTQKAATTSTASQSNQQTQSNEKNKELPLEIILSKNKTLELYPTEDSKTTKIFFIIVLIIFITIATIILTRAYKD